MPAGVSRDGPARVCALVINSVSRDARVLKQADSLVAAGHRVTVVGVKDAENTVHREERESGVDIIRVGWRSDAYRRLGMAIIGVAAALAVALVVLSFVFPYERLDFVATYVAERHFLPLFLYAGVAAVAWFGFRRGRAALITAGRYQAIEQEGEDADRPSSMRGRLRAALSYHFKTYNWTRPIAAEVLPLKPDVIHCHDVATLPIGRYLKRRLGCLLVYDAHEIYEEVAQQKGDMRDVYRRVQQRHTPAVDGFVTINDSIARFYAEHYPALPRPVVVKNAAVAVGPLEYDGRLHAAAGLPRDQRILLYQGGFARRRGLEVLVAAAAHLPAGWTLVMMGWGTLEEELRDHARWTEAQRRGDRRSPAVCFVPGVPQAELPYWTAGGTVGVIPYEHVGLNHWFCTPNKLWEYPNAGVPLLVSPFPEMQKVVEAYGIGWMLPDPFVPTAITGVLAGLSDEELERARRACKQFIAEDNWQVYADRLRALYGQLLSDGRNRRGNTSPAQSPLSKGSA